MELPVKQFQTRAEEAYADIFAAAEQALPGAGNPWVADLRAKAIDAYAALGLPHRRIEAWKYTDLRSKLTEPHPLARATGVALSEADIGRAVGDIDRGASRPIALLSSKASFAPISPISPRSQQPASKFCRSPRHSPSRRAG